MKQFLNEFKDTIAVISAIIAAFLTFQGSIVWSNDYKKDQAITHEALKILRANDELAEVRKDLEGLRRIQDNHPLQSIQDKIERLERKELRLESITDGI